MVNKIRGLKTRIRKTYRNNSHFIPLIAYLGFGCAFPVALGMDIKSDIGGNEINKGQIGNHEVTYREDRGFGSSEYNTMEVKGTKYVYELGDSKDKSNIDPNVEPIPAELEQINRTSIETGKSQKYDCRDRENLTNSLEDQHTRKVCEWGDEFYNEAREQIHTENRGDLLTKYVEVESGLPRIQ